MDTKVGPGKQRRGSPWSSYRLRARAQLLTSIRSKETRQLIFRRDTRSQPRRSESFLFRSESSRITAGKEIIACESPVENLHWQSAGRGYYCQVKSLSTARCAVACTAEYTWKNARAQRRALRWSAQRAHSACFFSADFFAHPRESRTADSGANLPARTPICVRW